MTIESEESRAESAPVTPDNVDINATDAASADLTDDVDSDALAAAEQKAEENWNLYLGAKAETDNIRKRSEKEVTNARLYALEKFVAELLPVKDSLEMGIKAAHESGDSSSVAEGTEMTLKMLEKALEKFGVKEVEVTGAKFDPELHEAVTMLPTQGVEPNTIIEAIQKGYTLNNRLVRPAMVVVAK